MIYTEKTKAAMNLCYKAHNGQLDKGGIPYVFHPLLVAEQMESEDAVIVALLHDVVEDTDYTFDTIAKMGFGEKVMDALVLLTHEQGVPYIEYIKNLKHNHLAREVKLADLKHNSDLTRLDVADDAAVKRVEKYKKAIDILEETGLPQEKI